MKDMIGNVKRNKVEEVDIPPVIGPDTPPLSHISPLSLRWSSTNPPLSPPLSSTIPFFQAFSVTSFAYLPLPLKQAYALVNPWAADAALRTLVNPDWRVWNLTFIFWY